MTRAGFLSSYADYDATARSCEARSSRCTCSASIRARRIPGATMMTRRPATSRRTRADRGADKAGELHGLPHRHQSAGLRAGELRRHRQVADDRPARRRDRSTPTATVNFGDGKTKQILAAAADAGDRADAEGQAAVRAGLGLLSPFGGIRTRTINASSTSSTPSCRGRLQHSQSARRSHPGGFLPFASPRNSVKAEETRP